ncbi:MAG: glycine betaine/L-proline ABC transporter substrate-binding protein ProX [Cyanobacteria bacterium P01_F01_bin.150]
MPIQSKALLSLVSAAFLAAGTASCQSPEASTDTSNTADASNLPGAGVTVNTGYGVLEEKFQTEIINIGLEKMGYTIDAIKELEYGPLMIEVGNGDIDFISVHWENNQRDFFENSGGDEKLEKMGIIIKDATQGYMIDKATADEHNITSLDQLSDPKIAALFDTDGDGKANLIGCTTGWACELIVEHHIDAYGLRDTVQQDQGKYFALIADSITRVKQNESALFYTWTPLWLSNVLVPDKDVVWLPVPYTDMPEAQGDISEADTTAYGKNLGFAVEQVYTVANQEFVDNNPAAAEFMRLVQVPIADVNAQNQLIQEGEDSLDDIRGHAESWIEDNQATFDGWVEAAIAAQ